MDYQKLLKKYLINKYGLDYNITKLKSYIKTSKQGFRAGFKSGQKHFKIKRRDIKKEQPSEFQKCLIFPQWVMAEWQDGRFYNNSCDVMYLGVKTWVPCSEIRGVMEG